MNNDVKSMNTVVKETKNRTQTTYAGGTIFTTVPMSAKTAEGNDDLPNLHK